MDALGINGPFLIAQIVNFVLLLLLLRAFLYKPVLKMLESRKQRIAEGLQAAEVARREAEVEQEANCRHSLTPSDATLWSASLRLLTAVKPWPLRLRPTPAKKGSVSLRMPTARAPAASRERILAEAQDEVAELALLAAEKVLGRELSKPPSQHAFVTEFLAADGKARG